MLVRPVGVAPQLSGRERLVPDAHFVNLSDKTFTHSRRGYAIAAPATGFGRHGSHGDRHAVNMQSQLACVTVVNTGKVVPMAHTGQAGRRGDALLIEGAVVDSDKPHIRDTRIETQFVVNLASALALDYQPGTAEGGVHANPGFNRPGIR